MKFCKLLCLAVSALLAAAAGAADARLVRLNVIATDSHGQPVADLTSSDFQVADGGKAQEIAFFRLTPVKAQLVAPAGAGEFSNRSGGAYPHATLILFDLLNSQMTDRGFSSAEIARDLQGMETGDNLYFYLMTKDAKLFPVRGLPDGPADLKAEATPWTKKVKPLLDEALKKVNALRPGDRVIDTQVKQTYALLNNVVATMALMPGRNSVIWISHGVPLSVRLAAGADEIKYTPLLKQLAVNCERSRTTMFTVDPTGGTPTSDAALSATDTLQQVANLSGGLAYRGDDVATATRVAMAEVRANYRIEYAPAGDSWDGKLHKLRVTCGRKGVNLQVKQSYYADAPAEGELDKAALQTAVTTPFDDPDIGLGITIAPGKAAQSLRFHILVDPGDVLLTRQGDRYTAQMDIAFVQYTAQGPKSVSPPMVASVSLTQAQYETAQKSGIPVDEELAVGADIRKVRAIVYDRGTDLSGSLTFPVGQ
jgi:VWFA-related protein